MSIFKRRRKKKSIKVGVEYYSGYDLMLSEIVKHCIKFQINCNGVMTWVKHDPNFDMEKFKELCDEVWSIAEEYETTKGN